MAHADNVLAGILNVNNPRKDLLGVAILRLKPEHFPLEAQRLLFKTLIKYYDVTGQVMPYQTYANSLENADIDRAKAVYYLETYKACEANEITESDFRWSVEQLIDEQTKRLTGEAIVSSMEILEHGMDVGREHMLGQNAARKFLTQKLHEIDRLSDVDTAPEGNVFDEVDAILNDYENRASGKAGRGILSGIRCIDDHTDGFQKGELSFVVAGPGQGKSQVVTQAAWDAAVMQKKNVLFATSETLRDQVIRRLLARHSRLSKFDKCLDSSKLKKGTLSEAEQKVFRDVLEDWRDNKDRGILNVIQLPAHSTLAYVENRLKAHSREHPVDLIVIDYLALLKAESKRTSEREEFNEIIRGAKGIAQGFNDGEGVPILSPWQITREAQEAVTRLGRMTSAALSDTSESTKSADQIWAIIRDEDNSSSMSLQCLKMRDDAIPPIQSVAIDFSSTYIGNHTANTAIPVHTQTLNSLAGFE